MAANSRNRPARESDLPGEVVDDICSSARRRAMLACLAEADGAVAVDDLAREVGARERGGSPESVDSETRLRLREEIYDRHLPKLTATGVVEYDSMREAVRLVDETVVRER